jgi:phosphotransferase system enzyme I (PtsI)
VGHPRTITLEEIEPHLERFDTAVQLSEKDLLKIARVAKDKIGASSAHVFEAQAMMLRDPSLYDVVRERISSDRWSADYAVQSVLDRHQRRMEASESAYLRERAQDLADVQHRLLRHLQQERDRGRVEEGSIVVAPSLTAADLILFSRQNISGLVLDYAGQTAHLAIIARALGLPAVSGLHGDTDAIRDDATIVLDALNGHVICEPTQDTVNYYNGRKQRYQVVLEEQKSLAPLPAVTTDGTDVRLAANLEFEEETTQLSLYGARGVGLFRTEFMFLSHGPLPSEEDQLYGYRSVVERIRPDTTTFRLVDLGGDKVFPAGPREPNPYLGWRGIRILLERDDILLPQLRALLRASTVGPIRILLPMVTDIQEVLRFKEILERVKMDLVREELPFDRGVQIGIMVEVPAAAQQAHHFAREVDFFSIGTNDLTQYVLAVDRLNDRVAYMFEEMHPAVLEHIRLTIEAGLRAGIPVSMCGEMAANPEATPILLGLGLREFSAAPIFLPEVKRVIREISVSEAEKLAQAAVDQPDAAAVHDILRDWLIAHNCGIEQRILRNETS